MNNNTDMTAEELADNIAYDDEWLESSGYSPGWMVDQEKLKTKIIQAIQSAREEAVKECIETLNIRFEKLKDEPAPFAQAAILEGMVALQSLIEGNK
jgi:hypothetical protein